MIKIDDGGMELRGSTARLLGETEALLTALYRNILIPTFGEHDANKLFAGIGRRAVSEGAAAMIHSGRQEVEVVEAKDDKR